MSDGNTERNNPERPTRSAQRVSFGPSFSLGSTLSRWHLSLLVAVLLGLGLLVIMRLAVLSGPGGAATNTTPAPAPAWTAPPVTSPPQAPSLDTPATPSRSAVPPPVHGAERAPAHTAPVAPDRNGQTRAGLSSQTRRAVRDRDDAGSTPSNSDDVPEREHVQQWQSRSREDMARSIARSMCSHRELPADSGVECRPAALSRDELPHRPGARRWCRLSR
jgi:hypothetical protein